MWPFKNQRIEARASYTDSLVQLIVSAAGGTVVPSGAETAATEYAASVYAGALAQCAVSDPQIVSPSFLALVGSELVIHGESVFSIEVDPVTGLELVPAASWDVRGGPMRSTWTYWLQLEDRTARPPGRNLRRESFTLLTQKRQRGPGKGAALCKGRVGRRDLPAELKGSLRKNQAAKVATYCRSHATGRMKPLLICGPNLPGSRASSSYWKPRRPAGAKVIIRHRGRTIRKSGSVRIRRKAW